MTFSIVTHNIMMQLDVTQHNDNQQNGTQDKDTQQNDIV